MIIQIFEQVKKQVDVKKQALMVSVSQRHLYAYNKKKKQIKKKQAYKNGTSVSESSSVQCNLSLDMIYQVVTFFVQIYCQVLIYQSAKD